MSTLHLCHCDKCSQAFTVFCHSSASIYYTEHIPNNNNGGGLGTRLHLPFVMCSFRPLWMTWGHILQPPKWKHFCIPIHLTQCDQLKNEEIMPALILLHMEYRTKLDISSEGLNVCCWKHCKGRLQSLNLTSGLEWWTELVNFSSPVQSSPVLSSDCKQPTRCWLAETDC